MNECRDDEGRWCYFHPREMVVGVCALCLNEELLVLASKQQSNTSNYRFTPKRVLPKILALTNLLNLSHTKHHKSEVYDTASSPCSPEDSFISIKFAENGVASWDKGKISKMSHDEMPNSDKTRKIKSVIEHTKPRASLGWRRPIGHLIQLIKSKRSSKGNTCHVGTKLEKEKIKYGWIRILTKRRAKE